LLLELVLEIGVLDLELFILLAKLDQLLVIVAVRSAIQGRRACSNRRLARQILFIVLVYVKPGEELLLLVSLDCDLQFSYLACLFLNRLSELFFIIETALEIVDDQRQGRNSLVELVPVSIEFSDLMPCLHRVLVEQVVNSI